MSNEKDKLTEGRRKHALKQDCQYNLCVELGDVRIRRTDINNLAIERRVGGGWKRLGWQGSLTAALTPLLNDQWCEDRGVVLSENTQDDIKEVVNLIDGIRSMIDMFFGERAPAPSKAADEALIPLVWEFKGYVIYRYNKYALAITHCGKFDDEPETIGWHHLYRTALGQMLNDVVIGPDIKTLDDIANRANEFLKWADNIFTDCDRHCGARDNLVPPLPGDFISGEE